MLYRNAHNPIFQTLSCSLYKRVEFFLLRLLELYCHESSINRTHVVKLDIISWLTHQTNCLNWNEPKFIIWLIFCHIWFVICDQCSADTSLCLIRDQQRLFNLTLIWSLVKIKHCFIESPLLFKIFDYLGNRKFETLKPSPGFYLTAE